jgi:hypothetical protein
MWARVPRYLHLPVQILWFDMEDIGMIIVCYTLAMIIDSWYAAPFVILVPYLFRTAKADKPRGYVRHILYANGLQSMRRYPSPQKRVFFE